MTRGGTLWGSAGFPWVGRLVAGLCALMWIGVGRAEASPDVASAEGAGSNPPPGVLSVPVDPYDSAQKAATALEQAGQFERAAERLEALSSQYPQDLVLFVRMGWLRFQAGGFEQALAHYRTATRISDESVDARLGQGFSLARLSRCDEARTHFLFVLSKNAAHAGAKEGLTLCPVPPTVAVQAGALLTGMTYGGHYQRKSGLAISPRLEVVVKDRWVLGAAYRFSEFFLNVTSQVQYQPPGRPGFPPPPMQTRTVTSQTTFLQHEAYGYAGYAAPRWGALVRYAFLTDSRGLTEASHHAGLSLRWSPAKAGEGQLHFATSLYRDMTVLRMFPSWRVPIYKGLALQVGGIGQWAQGTQGAQGTILGHGLVELSYTHPRLGLYAGGGYGDQIRPAALEWLFITNMTERVAGSAWGGAMLFLPLKFQLLFDYRYDRLRSLPNVKESTESDAHYFTFGLRKAF